MYKETDLAWAAGFIDGEGSICLLPRYNKSNVKSVTKWGVVLTLSAGQKARHPLEKLKEMFGGCIDGPRKNGVFFWRATSLGALEAIKLISPYLILKGPQAEVAISFYETVQPKAVGRRPLTEEELKNRWSFVEKIRELNSQYKSKPVNNRIRFKSIPSS